MTRPRAPGSTLWYQLAGERLAALKGFPGHVAADVRLGCQVQEVPLRARDAFHVACMRVMISLALGTF